MAVTSIDHRRLAGRRVSWILVLASSMTALNCFNDPLAPVPPKWDTSITVPLSNRTLTMLDIIARDSSVLKAGAGNQLVYSDRATAPPTNVSDRMSMSLPSSSSSMRLGVFNVVLLPQAIALQFPGLTPGSTTTVPPSTFDVPDIANVINGPVDATFASGRIRLTLVNNMPFPMSVETPIVIRGGSTVRASFSFVNPIPPGGSVWAEDDLAGDHLGTGDGVSGLRFSTPGSGGTVVTIPPSPLVATFSTTNLRASSATVTSVPAQRMSDNDVISLPVNDSTRIQSIVIRNGRADITFTSRLPIDVRLKFRIAELKRSSGNGLVSVEDSIMVPAGGSRVYPLDLAGNTLQSVSPAALLDSIRLTSSVIVPADINHTVTLHESDEIMIALHSTMPIIADTASIVLKPTWVAINSVIPFNFGKLPSRFSGALSLPAASLSLDLLGSLGFPADLHIRLLARKANGDSAVLLLPAGQQRIMPGAMTVRFDNAEVGQFLSQLAMQWPDSVRMTGSVLINPPDAYNPSPSGLGQVGKNSAFSGTMDLRVPLRLGITSGVYQDTLAWGDTNGDGSTESSSDRGGFNSMNSGVVYTEIQNGLPFQVGVHVQLLDRNRQSLLVIPQNGTDIQVDPAIVDANGNVTIAANSSAVIQLSGVDVRQFIAADFIRYALALNTPGGASPVSLKTSDGIHIRMWTQLSYRVNQ